MADATLDRRGGSSRPLARWAARRLIRASLTAHWILVAILRLVRRRSKAAESRPLDILLTGTFHADSWIAAHLGPLAASPHCRRVRMVATTPVPPIPKVEAVYPPAWLRQLLGSSGARLLTFAWLALRSRPDVAGGFHLLINGLIAQLVAAAAASRSLYFCVGGPAELADGGLASENPYFERLGAPDPVVARQLLRAAGHFDDIVTMGSRAAAFFRAHQASARVHVIGGAIDPDRFHREDDKVEFDIVFVGRLVPIKRIDRLLRASAIACRQVPTLRLAIVGDGALRPELEGLAQALGIADRVTFAGSQADTARWLQRSRAFMLTSASEGVSLSLMEALSCGLPAIVPAVGDLEDVVTDGVNGLIVRAPSDEAFAQAIVRLLTGGESHEAYRSNALATAARFEPGAVTALWEPVLLLTPRRLDARSLSVAQAGPVKG